MYKRKGKWAENWKTHRKKCSSILTVNNAYLNSNFLKINVKYFRHKNIVPLHSDSYSRLLKLLLVFWTFVSSCELCACVFVWKWLRIFSYNLTIRFFWRRKVRKKISLPQSHFLWAADFHMVLMVYTTEGTKPRTINSIQIKMITDILFLLSKIQNFHSQQHFTMLEAVMKTFRKAPNSVKFETVLRFFSGALYKMRTKNYICVYVNFMRFAKKQNVCGGYSMRFQRKFNLKANAVNCCHLNNAWNSSFYFICLSRSASVSLFVCHL